MVMESEMPIVAQLIASRPVPALLTPFSFGLDFHAFVLKLLQDHCFRVIYTLALSWELLATIPAAIFYAYDGTKGK